MVNHPYYNYKRTQVETANPGQLILMLYDGALKNLRLAQEHIRQKKIDPAHHCLVKAQDIVMELNRMLNMDAGEISTGLRGLYSYIYNRLVEANMKKDDAIVHEAIFLLSELKQAWDTIILKKNLTVTARSGVI